MPSPTHRRTALLISFTGLFSLQIAMAPPARAAGARPSGASPLAAEIDRRASALEPQMLEWRRHFHQHPELSGREVETAKFVSERLRAMGLEPRAIAGTGVTAVIAGKLPGATIALRADMDALPVAEQVDLPWKSTATGT